MIIFCDIDGVIANCQHRLRYLEEKNYDKFYSVEEMLKDKVIQAGTDLLNSLYDDWGNEIYFLTGRPERTLQTTKFWIQRECGKFRDITIWMRKDHDFRPAKIVKPEMIRRFIEGRCKILKDSPQKDLFLAEPILLIDDDPENIRYAEDVNENIIGILFGAKRIS